MHNKFTPNTTIRIDGAEYSSQGYQAGRPYLVNRITGMPYLCPDADGVVGLISDEEFDRLLECGRLEIIGSRTLDRAGLQNEVSKYTIAQAIEIDPASERMAEQCRMLDEAGIQNGDKAINNFMDKAWTEDHVKKYGPRSSARSIRRWRKTRGRTGHRHPRDMIRLNRVAGIRRRQDCANQQVMWKHAIEGWTDKSLPKDVHAAYAAEITQINEGRHPLFPRPEQPYKIVTERTIRRAYNWLESSATTETKKGKAAFEQDWAGGGRSMTADFAFHRVIIDHTPLDVFGVDDEFEMVLGRPWLTLAIDVRTRAIVAWLISFIPPCSWTVGEILRRMALPKRPPSALAKRYPVLRKIRGKPTEIVVDNAAEFRSLSLEAAVRCAGIGIRFCPVKAPRYRAVGERAMGTINREITRLLPGHVLPPADARRFDHDPEDEACLLMHDLEAIANMAIAIYNTEPHDGLGGRQPALMIERELNRNGITNFEDLASFHRDTMAVKENVQVSPSGCRVFGLHYHGMRQVRSLLDDLVPLESRRQRRADATATVDIRYDPFDISRIHVWNRRRRVYVELVCSDERYADGMPLWFHKEIQKKAAAEKEAFNSQAERLEARSRMIQAIRDISPNAKKKSREAVARLLEIPRIRQITGNIVELAEVEAEPVSIDEFISCDRAALTSLDAEILSARPTPREPDRKRNLRTRKAEAEARDRRDAGTVHAARVPADSPKPVRRPRPQIRGGFA